MSEESRSDIQMSFPCKWTYLAAAFAAFVHTRKALYDRIDLDTVGSGVKYQVIPQEGSQYIGVIQFVPTDDGTVISVQLGTRQGADYWDPILDLFGLMAKEESFLRRKALGATFAEVLDDYYARKGRGESPRLKVMAAEGGLNYGSLRQYKKRYDRRRRAE